MNARAQIGAEAGAKVARVEQENRSIHPLEQATLPPGQRQRARRG